MTILRLLLTQTAQNVAVGTLFGRALLPRVSIAILYYGRVVGRVSRVYTTVSRDRLSTSRFTDKIFCIKVRTVLRDQKQKPLHENNRYSVIDEILDIAAGSL